MTGVTDVQRTAIAIALAAVLLAPAGAAGMASGSGQPQPPQEEFVPIDQVPPEDQLPAAPLLITAYAIVWLVVFGYLWSIWRRLSAVERELTDLSRLIAPVSVVCLCLYQLNHSPNWTGKCAAAQNDWRKLEMIFP